MDIKKLKHRDQFGAWLAENGFCGSGVEVGVQYGENAKRILSFYEGEMTLIDPYIKWENGEYIDGCNKFDMQIAKRFSARYLQQFGTRIEWVYDTSLNALKDVPDGQDFVYLDGVHHNPVLRQDIEGYWEKVRVGGVLGGHDFRNVRSDFWVCEVQAEVEMFCKMRNLNLHVTPCTSWWIVKT